MDHKVPGPIAAFNTQSYWQGEASDDIQQLDIDSGSDFSEQHEDEILGGALLFMYQLKTVANRMHNCN